MTPDTTMPVEKLDAWQCPHCNCMTYARVDVRHMDGEYRPGADVRCVACKEVWYWPEARPAATQKLEVAEPVAWIMEWPSGGFTFSLMDPTDTAIEAKVTALYALVPAPQVTVGEDRLTALEAEFCLLVFGAPGCKLNSGENLHDENGKPLWRRMEDMGLIECVGSYKWVPTDALVSRLRAALSGKAGG